jgi:hypothetical protein
MSWSKDGGITPAGQKKIRIKTKHGEIGLTDLEFDQAGETVEISRQVLPKVIANLSWRSSATRATVNNLMNLYFLTGVDPSSSAITTVLSKLELVQNGISAKINLKVAPNASAYGYVGFKTGKMGVMRGIFSSRHNFGTRNGKIVSRGDIHIDQDTLDDQDLSIITFIHEATHKYASTADFGNSGYTDNSGLTFDAPGLTPVQALNNADSYAWFCFAMNRDVG